jgi:glycine cleavage system H protein
MSLHFTEDHEWIAIDGETGIIGISAYAAKALGDVVFVELPDIGTELDKGDEAAVVESVKAASEVYAPIGGEVTEVNGALEDEPAKVNEDPSGDGWFLKIKISDADELEGLMDEEAYKKYCDGL